jgi:hypothetical protein
MIEIMRMSKESKVVYNILLYYIIMYCIILYSSYN